jgi:hypothetical protein
VYEKVKYYITSASVVGIDSICSRIRVSCTMFCVTCPSSLLRVSNGGAESMTQAANRLPAPVPEPKILGGGEQGFTFLVKEPSRFGIISGGVTAISAKETMTPVGGTGFACYPR